MIAIPESAPGQPAARGVALVRMPVAPVHAEPRVSSAQTSQALFGRMVSLHGAEGDWHRARTSPDGYEGWVHAGYLTAVALAPDDASGLEHALIADTDLRVSLGATVRAGGRTLRLPLGAWVAADAAPLAGELVPLGELPVRFPREGAAAVATATRYFESTSYQWGGVTPWGADCSGLVQSVYALHGVDLPRDAWQQALAGADAGLDLRAHRAGDLLFFSEREDRRVTHVGLATGDRAMCHLALGRGGWAVDALAEPEDAYAERLAGRLVAARRVAD